MTWWDAVLLVGGGLLAGVINTMAGGGSALTVPLLVLAGVPGTQANGSNRVGVLASSLAAAESFRRTGATSTAGIRTILIPTIVGSVIGSYTVSQLADGVFEKIFGLLMIPIVLLTVRKPKIDIDVEPWPTWVTAVVFTAIGLYGGAFQAGLGLVLLAALTHAGYDLITANNIKVLVSVAVTAIALPVFIVQGDVVWAPALVLAAGFTTGGWFGAKLAVRGGQRLVRVFMIGAGVFLAGKLLGLWG